MFPFSMAAGHEQKQKEPPTPSRLCTPLMRRWRQVIQTLKVEVDVEMIPFPGNMSRLEVQCHKA